MERARHKAEPDKVNSNESISETEGVREGLYDLSRGCEQTPLPVCLRSL